MALWTLNGFAVLDGSLTLPSVGCWTARVRVDSAEVIAGPVVLASDALEWNGAIVRGRVVQGVGDWLLVGGAGGLRSHVEARPYRSATLDDVLADVLADVGEHLSPESSALFGFTLPFWLRMPGPAHHVVAEVARVAGLAWRVRADGAVWLGSDLFETVETPDDFDVLGEVAAHDRLLVAGDVLGIVPGVQLLLPDGDALRVGVVEHRMEPVNASTVIWRAT